MVGSAELLAAAFGLGSLILYYRGRRIPALVLFALAVFSKESAAAFAALPLVFPVAETSVCAAPREQRGHRLKACATAFAAMGIIAAALLAHRAVSRASLIPPIDNPMGLLAAARAFLAPSGCSFCTSSRRSCRSRCPPTIPINRYRW